MTNQEAIKYAKTRIDNIRKYEGNEQFIAAMDIVIAVAEKANKEWIEMACEWLDADIKGRHDKSYWMLDELVDRFRKAMEE